ncbi:type II restriction endonuclease [uncultured Hyphomonas sp.]|uniref:type II restriction endonuclease n=1 Tax=uncultured Hyphomonas sp. TaxID=225298 RepID=UPI000C6AF91C|nr:type II restriction endonuclease [Hyphomonadaceae bacterium]MBA27244.1 type II restriction endonuclease [Hyphomonadaceae bacterium]|tara:strand:- start:10 stop:1212 length:1203 start_codon:yes stop_codon:yes gene_type:complete
MEIEDWIDEVSGANFAWYIKRLSGNDTQLTGGHQAGPYVPKSLAVELLPQLSDLSLKNPRELVELRVLPDGFDTTANLIYYNNKFHDNPSSGRNETRLTALGGRENPLLDPENTGALTIFAFEYGAPVKCQVWICQNREQEALFEDEFGPVEPSETLVWSPNTKAIIADTKKHLGACSLSVEQIPSEWLVKFPSGLEIIKKSISLRPDLSKSVDERLLRRRDCEFEVFRSVEQAFFFPKVRSGFQNLDEFLAVAQSVLQSRKSRAGKSLEYHAKSILDEEGFVEGIDYEYNPKIEGNKKPDFLFPSVKRYNDGSFPAERLTILAAKTTCKDRWRQILNEADRVPTKHLLTLQEGVSINQYEEMSRSGVRLVVPKKLHKKYPSKIRSEIMTLAEFMTHIKN